MKNPHEISGQTTGLKGSLADLKDRTLDPGHAAPHGLPATALLLLTMEFPKQSPSKTAKSTFLWLPE